MFCRLRYYNEDSLKGIEIPVLDRYFFVSLFTPSDQIPLPPPEAIVDAVPEGPSLDFASNINFFMQQNQQKLGELSNLLNKGIVPAQPIAPPGVKARGAPTGPTPGGTPQFAPANQPSPNTGAPGGGAPGGIGGGGGSGGGGY